MGLRSRRLGARVSRGPLGASVLALLGPVTGLWGQQAPPPVLLVERVVVQARADASSASVGIEYTTSGGDRFDGVGVRILPVADRAVTVLTAGDGERARRVGLGTDEVGMIRGVLEAGPGAAAPTSRGETLALRYGVDGAWVEQGDRFELVLPLVTLDVRSAAARAGLWRLDLRLPAGVTVLESFPSSLRAEERDGEVVVGGQLSVLPALVRIAGRTDGRRIGGVRVAENAVLLLIVGLGLLGWRHLRRTV